MSELVKCKDKLPGEEVVGDTILYLLYLNIDNWTPSIPPSSYTKEKIGAHDLFLKVVDTLQLTPMQLSLHAEDSTHSAFEVVYYTVLSNLWQEQLICSEIPVVNMDNQKVALASAGWVHLMSTGVIDENRENLILPGQEVLENTIYYILKRQNYWPILSDDLYDMVVDLLELTSEQLSFMKTIHLNSDGLTSVIPVLKYRFLRELQLLAEHDQIRLWLLPHSNLSYRIFVPGYGRRVIDAALEADE